MSRKGLLIGGCVGLFFVLVVNMGAAPAERPRAYPRYSVEANGQCLIITDNDKSVLYIYADRPEQPGAAKLKFALDLTQVGKNEIVGESAEVDRK
jgi:hypothetical protein